MGVPALQAPAAPRVSGAAGPQAYTQNLTASLSFVAAINRSPAKSFTAILSSTVALTKKYVGAALTATLSFVGNLAASKIFVRVLAATLSFSAAFGHTMAKMLTATLTSTGAFTKKIAGSGFAAALSFVASASKTLLFLRTNFSATLFSAGTGSTGVMDSYSESNATATIHIAAGDESIGVGQCFTGNGAKIIDAKFYLQRHSNPTGNAVAKIYTMTGTFGVNGNVGTLLATSDGIDVTTLGNGVPGLITFTFTGAQQYITTNGANYVVTCEFTGGNTSNYVEIFYDGTSATHPGTWTFTTDLITWTPTDAGIDICFYVDGVVTGGPSPTLTRRTGKSPIATLSFVGSVSRQIGKTLSATLSFIGAVTKLSTRALSATLSFVGNLATNFIHGGILFTKNFAAILSFTGFFNASKSFLKVLSATLSFSGALSVSRSFLKVLTATLSFTGILSRRTSKALSAGLSVVGAILKRSGIAKTATLSFIPLGAGGTTYNSNGTPSDIQSIHDTTAHDGDTITLPAGSFGWSTTLSLTKAVRLQGQGSGRIVGWSKSSVTFGTGAKTFTVQSGFTAAIGATLRIWQTATNKETNYMLGTVTSVSGTTLTMSITTNTGSGTFLAWLIATEYSTRVVHNAGTNTLITASESTAGNLSISGIQFTSGTGTSHTIEMVFTSGGKPILIHDCWFNQTTDGVDPGGVQGTIQNQSTNRGVIWNCSADWTYFGSSNSAFLHMTFNSNVAVWTALSTMGMADTGGTSNFYIEDCDFHGSNAVTDADNNIKIVVRHCVFDNAQFNSHGYDTSPYGVRHWELYNNQFIFTDQGPASFNLIQYIMCRGGTGVITDNSFEDINSGAFGDKAEITFAIYCLGDWIESPGAYSANDGGLVQYPAPRQFGFGYITGSGVDGQGFTTRRGVYVGDSEPTYVWNNTGFTPVIGIVTNNAASWIMDDPNAYIQSGRDYFLSAKSGYTKYTYPHPLTIGGGGVAGIPLTKKVLKGLTAATLSFAGSLATFSAHFFTRSFTATLSFVGALTRTRLIARAFTAALGMTGAISRKTTKIVGATVTFSTVLGKRIRKVFAATLSFLGFLFRGGFVFFQAGQKTGSTPRISVTGSSAHIQQTGSQLRVQKTE